MSSAIAVKFENVAKRFGNNLVLDKINLSINEGEIFGIIGRSGSGKTTMLNLLIGFMRPQEGNILYNITESGVESFKSVLTNPVDVKKKFGFAAQTPSFYPKLTVMENLRYFAALYSIPKSSINSKADELLEMTNLTKFRDLISQNLSGGMQKRLDIACSLIHNPPLLILDEPTADLDPISRKQIWALIRKVNDRGVTIILASHFLAEMETLCTRVAILDDGKIVRSGTLDELKTLYTKEKELILETSSRNYDALIKNLRKIGVKNVKVDENRLIIYTPEGEKTLAKLLRMLGKKESLLGVELGRPSLDEVFISLAKK